MFARPVNRILVAVAIMSEKNQEASTAAVALLPVLLSGDPNLSFFFR